MSGLSEGASLPILGRILRDRGVITDRQLQEAIQHQVLYGGRLGTSLYELGFITEERLTDALSRAPRRARDRPQGARSPRRWRSSRRSSPQRFKVFPCRLRGQTLFLGMVDPGDHAAVAQIGYSLGYIVRPAGGARVPDGAAAPRPLRRRRALAPHRHARAPRPRCPQIARPRRGGGAHRRRHDAATRWWRRRSRSAAATSGACCSSSCASRGCWAGTASARASTARAPPRCASRSTCRRCSRP